MLNGSGVGGQGGQTAAKLQAFGFNTAGTGDADAFNYTTPVVKYGRGQQLKARLLAAYIQPGAQLKAGQTLSATDGLMIKSPVRENRIIRQR